MTAEGSPEVTVGIPNKIMTITKIIVYLFYCKGMANADASWRWLL